jgi:hypothetical protein
MLLSDIGQEKHAEYEERFFFLVTETNSHIHGRRVSLAVIYDLNFIFI